MVMPDIKCSPALRPTGNKGFPRGQVLYNRAMELPFFQVDAFATEPFTGNPAVVYRLDA